MELAKQQTDKLIRQATELLVNAHIGYYKNSFTNEDLRTNEKILEALKDILS